MVEGAALLLARQGLQGTSFSELIELTGAPRGSVYHHFPEGKDQLVGSALDLVGARLLAALEQIPGTSALEVTEHFLRITRSLLSSSQCEAGCAVLAVTVAAGPGELLQHAASIFSQWRQGLSERLVQAGLQPVAAGQLAATLIAASEGAIVLGRAEHSLEVFDLVAAQLRDMVRRLG